MKYLAGLLAAFLAVSPALAGEMMDGADYVGVRNGDVTGKVMDPGASSPATNDTFDFGFEAHHVKVCVRPQSASAAAPIFFRLGHTLTTSTTQATSDNSGATLYIQSGDFVGTNSIVTTRALPFYSAASSNDEAQCFRANWITRGLTMFISSGNATADVWAYRRPQPPRR